MHAQVCGSAVVYKAIGVESWRFPLASSQVPRVESWRFRKYPAEFHVLSHGGSASIQPSSTC